MTTIYKSLGVLFLFCFCFCLFVVVLFYLFFFLFILGYYLFVVFVSTKIDFENCSLLHRYLKQYDIVK